MISDNLNKIRKITSDYWRSLSMWLIAAAACIAQWYLFNHDIGCIYPNFIGTLMKCIGEVALILSPFWLLKPKWRWTIIIPIWVSSLWIIINVTYFRFWKDLLPPSALTMTENMDHNLLSYGIALLHPHDIWYLLIPIATTIVYFLLRPGREREFSNRIKLWSVAGSVFLGIASQFSFIKTELGVNEDIGYTDTLRIVKGHYNLQMPANYFNCHFYGGNLLYGIHYLYDLYQILTYRKELSYEEKEEIKTFLNNYTNSGQRTRINPDSLNIVYIIVESLNADVLNRKIEGFSITPTLDSIANLPGSVVFDNVAGQVKYSGSSDGHLILMTGLLPPEKTSYVFMFGDKNSFPSIGKALENHHKYILLADEGNLWNESAIFENFGLGKPKTINQFSYSDKEYGRDGAMFKEAEAMLDTIHHPFMMTLMTISMHLPFEEEAWEMPEALKKAKSLSNTERKYLNVTHGFDKYLGHFLRKLPKNTIVFIASDHGVGLNNYNNETNGGIPIVFMALNTSRTEHISRKVGQVNLYPATLELLGIYSPTYHGIAPSAFDPKVDGTLNSYGEVIGHPTATALDSIRRAYHISDLIIRGNYFH